MSMTGTAPAAFDPRRMRLSPELVLAVLASLGSWAILVAYFASASGHLDITGYAVGRDFVNYWTAGQLTSLGRVLEIFDPATFLAAERSLFDPALPMHFWSYPPTALLFTAPLGPLGYFPALIAWLGVTGLAAAWALDRLYGGRRAVLLIVAAPAVAVNIVLGQNGFLTTALLVGGLAAMDRRPVLAGVLLGLLTFKPQLGLLVPVALVAAGAWRVVAAAIVTAALLVLASIGTFGVSAWAAFFSHTLEAQTISMTRGTGLFQLMTPSAFMGLRLLGASPGVALAVQAVFLAAAAIPVWRIFRAPARPAVQRIAVLAAATFAASPQSFNYDMVPVAVAALLLLQAPRPLARSLGFLGWALPVLMMPLNRAGLPVSALVCLAMAWTLSAGPDRARQPS